jgi:tetratricopeptide (TPR) repeat protein
LDSSPGRAEAAARALESAIRLDPDGAETHLAAAYYYYWVQRDYERALRELARAREQLPGSGEVLHLTGVILRRDGQLDSAIHYLKGAAQLDPARPLPFTYLAESLAAVGRFAEANRAYQLALEKDPDDPYTLRMYGEMYIAWRGETDTLRAAASRMAPGGRVLGGAPAARFRVAMLERNCSAAAAAVQSAPELMGLRDFVRPRALYQAWAAECAGAPGRARSYYLEAERLARRMLVQDLPEPAAYLALGQALVGLGRYKEGLDAARKAVSLLPYEHDAFDGGYLITEQAALCVRAGEKEAALDLLERYTGRPFAPWPNELRLDPRWDALRGSPRFQRLVRE